MNKFAHQFNSADFEPDQIMGVVNDTHFVGLGVTNTQTGLANGGVRSWMKDHALL
jgi:hypothetical protein